MVQELPGTGVFPRLHGNFGTNSLAGFFGRIAGEVRLVGVPPLHIWFTFSSFTVYVFLMATTGTTGKPKGCLLNHRGIYWAIKAMCEYPRRVTNPATDKRLAMACACILRLFLFKFDSGMSSCRVRCAYIRDLPSLESWDSPRQRTSLRDVVRPPEKHHPVRYYPLGNGS